MGKATRERQRLGIPTEREVQDRLKRWLRYYVDKSSKTAIHKATSISLAHISNLYNREERKPSLDFLICMVFGMDASPRELLREEPPVSARQTHTDERPNGLKSGRKG